MKDKGFILVETIIVSTIISVFLISTFTFTSMTIKKYEQRQKYDQIDSVYSLNSIKMFLYKYTDINSVLDKLDNFVTIELTDNDIKDNFIEIIDKSEGIDFYNDLKNEIGLTNLYLSQYANINIDNNNDLQFEDYIKTIDIGDSNISNKTDYRLIGKFKNNNYATINIYRVD